MKLQEIFKQPGLYTINGFSKGNAIKIVGDDKCMTLVSYDNANSTQPFNEDYPCVSEIWFEWDFKKVVTIQSLFD